MTRQEYLLAKISEESHEVGQRAIKALRFGIYEIQEGQGHDNLYRMLDELADLHAAIGLLLTDMELPPDIEFDEATLDAKKARIEEYLEYSKTCGAFEDQDDSGND